MSFSTVCNVDGCAEVVLATAKQFGLRVEIFEPDLGRDVKFKITAANRAQFKAARALWGRRLYVGGGESATRSRL